MNAGKSLSIERSGQTWLPIGRPSGFAASLAALAASNPAEPAPIAALFMNSRLDIAVISIDPFIMFPPRTLTINS
jgi:hypothetical protein